MASARPLKSLSAVGDDIVDYLVGRSAYLPHKRAGEKWLFPLDVEKQLKDRNRHFGPFDASGLPLWPVSGMPPQPNVSRTAAYGHAHWNGIQLGCEEASEEVFLACADWFMTFREGLFFYQFPASDMDAPWLSCMGQGVGIALLARAHLHTGEVRFAEQAKLATRPLMTDVDDGGLLGRLPDGSIFVQEFPGSRHANVLNGALYCLCGVCDLIEIAPGSASADLVEWRDRHVISIAENLGNWTQNGWTLYEYLPESAVVKNFNTPTYQMVHIALLARLAEYCPDSRFARFCADWTEAFNSPVRRLGGLKGKLRYRTSVGW